MAEAAAATTAAPAATSPAAAASSAAAADPPKKSTGKKIKDFFRKGIDGFATSFEGLSPELKIALHSDKLKRNTNRYSEQQQRQMLAIEAAYKHVAPTAVHPFYSSATEPLRARLFCGTYEKLVDYPQRQVPANLDRYRTLVKEIHTYINNFQRERYQLFDQNDLLRAIDSKLRLNDPINVALQELKEWLVLVVECSDSVSVRKHAPSATTYLGALNGKSAPSGNKLDMAQALLELKNFSVTSNVSRQVDNYRCYLQELMACSEFGFSSSVAFGQIASAITAIGVQADADCKEAIEVKCLDEINSILSKLLHALFEYLIFALSSKPIHTSSVLYEHITDDGMGKMYGLNHFKMTRAGLLMVALLEAPAMRAVTSAAKCSADLSHNAPDDDSVPTQSGGSLVTPSLFMKKNLACIPDKECWGVVGRDAPTEHSMRQAFFAHQPAVRRKKEDRSQLKLSAQEESDEALHMWFAGDAKTADQSGLAKFFTARGSDEMCMLTDPKAADVTQHELYGIQPAEIRACFVKLHEFLHQLAVFSIVNEQTRTICAESKLSVYGTTLKQPVCDALEVCKQLLVNIVKTIERMRFLTLHVLGHFNQVGEDNDRLFKIFTGWRINYDRATDKCRDVKRHCTDCLQLVEYTLSLIQSRSVEDVEADHQARVDELLRHANNFTEDACRNLELPEVVVEGMPSTAAAAAELAVEGQGSTSGGAQPQLAAASSSSSSSSSGPAPPLSPSPGPGAVGPAESEGVVAQVSFADDPEYEEVVDEEDEEEHKEEHKEVGNEFRQVRNSSEGQQREGEQPGL